MANNAAKIAEIRALLQTGATDVSVDGTRTAFDVESLRKELRRLEAEDATMQTQRPVAASVYLGGF
jgi:hypothetical protein